MMGYCSCDGNVTTATNKTHNPALTAWFCRVGKKEEYAKPRTEWREVRYGKIWLTTVAVTQDLLSGMCWFFKKITHPPLEQYITCTGTTKCSTVQTHAPHCMQEGHACNKPVVWDSLYPMVVAFWNTHKGKRWLNSDPPNYSGSLKKEPHLLNPKHTTDKAVIRSSQWSTSEHIYYV